MLYLLLVKVLFDVQCESRLSWSLLEKVQNSILIKLIIDRNRLFVEDQASEWFDILHKAIENSRYTAQAERGPIVEFGRD